MNGEVCYLKKIGHEDAKRRFDEESLLCPVFKRDNGSLPTICFHCCIRISQLRDAVGDLIVRGVVDKAELERNPEILLGYKTVAEDFYPSDYIEWLKDKGKYVEPKKEPYLAEKLKPYYEVLLKKGITIDTLNRECHKCRSGINRPEIGIKQRMVKK